MNKVCGLRLQHFLLASAALFLSLIFGAQVMAQDSAEHSMDSMSHDDHKMTPEMFAVFRERVPALAESTDQQIELQMKMMDPGESRYISAASVKGDAGVLVLIHGFGPTGDRIMSETVEPLAGIFPSVMSSGMSMMSAAPIQESLDALEQAGVKKIVVVPMVSSQRNTLMYQWQYIFGEREHGGYYDVPRVTTDAEIIITDPPAGHPLITQILLDHALEMSTDPDDEVVIVIAHGPIHEEENQAQLAVMAGQAKRIQELGGFSSVEGMTLQDDATVAVRAANVVKLRQKVEAAIADEKRVLIVADLLAARSIQWKIEKDLAGLDYQFSVKGTTMHRNFKEWFQETVSNALK